MSTPRGNHVSVRVKEDVDKFTKQDPDDRKKFLFWCSFVAFWLAAGICVASFTVPSLRKKKPNGLAMWQWTLLVTVLLFGPLFSKIVHYMFIFVGNFIIDTKYGAAMARINVIYYVIELIESAWVVLWFSMILVAWMLVVDEPSYLGMPRDQSEKIKKKFAKTLPLVNITLVTLIIGSILWLLKDLVLMMAKSSFHISKFYDRVNDALIHQHVINKLTPSSDQPVDGASKSPCQLFLSNKCNWREEMPSLEKVIHQPKKNVSSWGMQTLINWFSQNKNLTYKINGKDKEIESEDDAIAAAKDIYSKLALDEALKDGIKQYIEKTKIKPVDQVSEVICRLFARPITENDLEELMVKAFKYRKTLARVLKANKKLFIALNRFIDALLIFFIFALWLIMLRVETRKVIIFIATAIVGSAVIVGDTCKKLLDNLLFVFVMHPFDIGDYCLIDNTMVTIKSIKILTTVVSTVDKEIRYYPNSLLAATYISNYTRSRKMGDFVEFYPETGASIEDIQNGIESYITDSKYWKEHRLVMELTEENKMKMKLHVKHTFNSYDVRERQKKKSELVLEIAKILRQGSNINIERETPKILEKTDKNGKQSVP